MYDSLKIMPADQRRAWELSWCESCKYGEANCDAYYESMHGVSNKINREWGSLCCDKFICKDTGKNHFEIGTGYRGIKKRNKEMLEKEGFCGHKTFGAYLLFGDTPKDRYTTIGRDHAGNPIMIKETSWWEELKRNWDDDDMNFILEIMYEMNKSLVDKDMIHERKSLYGNNFPHIAMLWKRYMKDEFDIDIDIKPEQVSKMMALMKITRYVQNPDHEDSVIDLINYLYISYNYDEYEKS